MTSEKPLYQPWSEESFRSSIHVQAMSSVQRWMYRTLLQAMFCEATRPYLPNDDELLWKLAGCENKEQWLKNKEALLKQFKLVENETLWENTRVTKDWLRLIDFREERSFSGRKGAESRWNGRAIAPYGTAIANDGKEVKEVRNISKLSKAQFPDTKISEIWETLTGQKAEDKKLFRKELKELIHVYGEDAVFSQFEIWVEMNQGRGFKRPISLFIKQFESSALLDLGVLKIGDINELAVRLSFLSGGNVVFGRFDLNGLANLSRDFTQEEIENVFKHFYSESGRDDLRWAAKNFLDKAPQMLLVARRLRQEEERNRSAIENLKVQILSTTPVNRAQAAQDALDEETTIKDFNLGLESPINDSDAELTYLERPESEQP